MAFASLRRGVLTVAALASGMGMLAGPAVAKQSDGQIRQAIIRQSIANYSGSCPCPYNVMRNGRSCGGRSAYSRPGGESPKCYADDVSQAEVNAYRRR
jgi:hypothetical protein